MNPKHSLFFLFALLLAACADETRIKPKAQLRLDYTEQAYHRLKIPPCPFSFEVNTVAKPLPKENCWINLDYPRMKGTLYLTYHPVRDNLEQLLYDAQKLTYDHSIKASNIIEYPRVDPVNRVYGMFYSINGNAATPAQFYITDSVQHFISGSVYFKSKPNYDSLYPAAMYLRDDMRRIMETVTWEE